MPILTFKNMLVLKGGMQTLFKTSCIIFLFSFAFSSAAAQEVPDSKGRDFWLTFLPNYHNNRTADDPRLRFGDSLYIFVAASEPTTGVITYRNRFGKEFTENFAINDPANIYTFRVSYYDFELLGLNESGEPAIYAENAKAVKHSFHVETSADVTVYALNQAFTTSDAFLVLPTDALGEDYMIMSYNSDRVRNEIPTPSEFAVVATEDNTEITITPQTFIFGETDLPVVKTLNRGEVYLVQANVLDGEWRADLTGTEVSATKPIAVFAGHQRATTPNSYDFDESKSRDHLVEQMPPIDTWGRRAFLIPYPEPRDADDSKNGATDSYRILSGYDGTEVRVNGAIVATINRGEFFEAPLTQPAVVLTSRPSLIAQFKKTSDVPTGPAASKLSDPFMMLIPPSEQFLNSYRFMNAQAYFYDFENGQRIIEPTYVEQFISLVVPTSSIPAVRLDGAPVPAGRFAPIPGSVYSYAAIRMPDGVHTVEADTNIGLYVYGYGLANSYGYIGGMAFRPIDFQPPQITSEEDCFRVSGLMHDSLISSESYIDSVALPERDQRNVDIRFNQFAKDSLSFSAELFNKFSDGEFTIFGMDGAELFARDTFSIPGFTIGTRFIKGSGEIDAIEEEVPENKERCYTVQIFNYGKYPHSISKLGFLKETPEYRFESPAPLIVQPGDTVNISVCFKSDSGSFTDTLYIESTCTSRNVAVLKLNVVSDNQPPTISQARSSCGDIHVLTVSELLQSDMGIASVEVIENTNMTFSFEGNIPVSARLSGLLTDPFKDGFYTIRTIDSMGNVSELRDTIQGFTIAFPGIAVAGDAIVYNENTIGFLSCDSLKISNYGLLPFHFKNPFMLENVYFSVPPAQFPITLQPGEERWINICYRPLETRSDGFKDTLIFAHNCLVKQIPLRGESIATTFSSNANCEVKLRLTTEKVPAAFSLEQNIPNPVQQETSVSFSVKESGPVKIALYDARGMLVTTILNEYYAAGTYEMQFIVKDIPNGIYMYELQAGAERLNRMMLIAK